VLRGRRFEEPSGSVQGIFPQTGGVEQAPLDSAQTICGGERTGENFSNALGGWCLGTTRFTDADRLNGVLST